MKPAKDPTPLMKQFLDIKNRHPDALLFFRVGDFYEMFYEDAKTASKILDIALTTRDKNKEEAVPLCGVPYHAASTYIARLIRAGRKVAVCEQMEDARKVRLQPGGGIVKREVVRVITPGTVVDPDLLDAREPLYIAAVAVQKSGPLDSILSGTIGMAYLSLSTGEFRTTEIQGAGRQSLADELATIQPRELLVPPALNSPHLFPGMENQPGTIQVRPDWHFEPDLSHQILCKHFGVPSLNGYGCAGKPAAIAAAGALLRYVMENQKGSVTHITALSWHSTEDHMVLDPVTRTNLELTQQVGRGTGRQNGPDNPQTLLGLLDHSQTPMGSRMLRDWVLKPLRKIEEIQKRLEAVNVLFEDYRTRSELRSSLSAVHDLERLISRIGLGTANARDLNRLKNSLKDLPEMSRVISHLTAPLIRDTLKTWDDLQDIYQIIDDTLAPDPPLQLHQGGLIKPGANPELETLRTGARDGKDRMAGLESQERKRTGINSLKIRYNQVFGYYIEITRSKLRHLPSDYTRKQTLVNAERFITPELKALEQKVLGAEGQLVELEYKIFENTRSRVAGHTARIQEMARKLASLDVLSTLAEVAHLHHYVRPQVHAGLAIRITDGRHPVLERLNLSEGFVPNDTLMDHESHRLLMITGPNMAGKSTYMRQVALIVLMAQMGSFVPAREASIGLTDRIFTRVGAADDLTGGRSTFMVEMQEAANILHHATPNSLILLDEIGRGTSTFDGISIAWAVAEYIHTRIGARTLFATHYHELTDLAIHHTGIQNLRAEVRERNDEIIFLRKVVVGKADQSYGVQVARLAGLPPEVLDRAREVLAHLEPMITRLDSEISGKRTVRTDRSQDLAAREFLENITRIQTEILTPLQALNKLDEIRKRALNILKDPPPPTSPR